MKALNEMTLEELKEYDERCTSHFERARNISSTIREFMETYANKSKKENSDTIAMFERLLDSYEKESKELDFETSFVEAQRDLIPAMKILAGIN